MSYGHDIVTSFAQGLGSSPLSSAGFPVGAAISAGSDLLSSIGNIFFANKQLKAQQRENQLNRDFNASESQKARDFQLQMFNAENAYNDPSQVVSRLQKAGLNPALAFGGFADSASLGGTSAASSSGSVNPALPDLSGVGSAGNAFLDAEMKKAQIDLVKSQRDKNLKDVEWYDRAQTLAQDLGLSTLLNDVEQRNYTQKQGEALVKSMEEISQRIINMKSENLLTLQNIEIAISDKHIKQVAAKYAEAEKSAEIRLLQSKADLTDAEMSKLCIMLSYEIAESQSRTNLNNSQSDSLNFSNLLNSNNLKRFGLNYLSTRQIDSARAELELWQSGGPNGYTNAGTRFLDFLNSATSICGNIVKSISPFSK